MGSGTDDAADDVMFNRDTPHDSHSLQSRLTNGMFLFAVDIATHSAKNIRTRSPGWLLADTRDKNKLMLAIQYFKTFQFSFDSAPQHFL